MILVFLPVIMITVVSGAILAACGRLKVASTPPSTNRFQVWPLAGCGPTEAAECCVAFLDRRVEPRTFVAGKGDERSDNPPEAPESSIQRSPAESMT